MGFIGDIAGKIGNTFGFGGGANQYRSTNPVNTFSAGNNPTGGGIGNNSFQAVGGNNGFQGQQAGLQQTDFSGALQQAMGQGGPGGGVGQQQGDYANMLRNQIAGNGPSVAQQQLQQALQQNQMGAASAIGSQRGINPALAARMIGQNQASSGQQMAGQGAMLRSQEQMNAQGMLGQALQAQRGQDILGQQAQTGLIGTLGGLQQGQNSLTLQNSLGTQGMNLQAMMQNAGMGMQAQGMNNDASMQSQRLNAMTAGGNQQANLDAQRINAGIAGQNAGISSGNWAGLMNAAGGAMGKAFAQGGQVIGGGTYGPAAGAEVPSTFALDNPMSYIGINSLPQTVGPDKEKKKPDGSSGGADPYGADSFLTNDMTGGATYFDVGGAIPGQANVGGNSTKNDTVPIQASPGEIVLPRSVTQAADAPEKAAAFVRAIQRQDRQKEPGGYGNVLARVRELQQGLKDLEGMLGKSKKATA